ncbi:MAG TPA: hypothetical protein PLL02_04900, partial [Bacteroidales bacterium]|nr:hypothetical protein [Bacteroidales bacterium]
MKQEIKSKALEVNLSKTQKIKVDIPEEHLWFISLSTNYYGINQRTTDFFKELHHPYSNNKIVTDALIKILNDEFWVYKQLEEEKKEKVYDILFGIFKMLLNRKLPDKESKHIIQNYLQFFSNNFDDIKLLKNGVSNFIKMLDENMEDNLFSYLSNISFLRNSLKEAALHEDSKQLVFSFMKKLFLENINFWESTTKIEEWYESVKDKFSEDYSAIIQQIGKEFYKNYRQHINQAKNY